MKRQVNVRLEGRTRDKLEFLKAMLGTTDASIIEMGLNEFAHTLPIRLIHAAPLVSWALLDQKCRQKTRRRLDEVDVSRCENDIASFDLSEDELNDAVAKVVRDPLLSDSLKYEGWPPGTLNFKPTKDDEAIFEQYRRCSSELAADRAAIFDNVKSIVRRQIRENFLSQKEFLRSKSDAKSSDCSISQKVPAKLSRSVLDHPERLKAVEIFHRMHHPVAEALRDEPTVVPF